MLPNQKSTASTSAAIGIAGAVAAIGTALWVRARARRAERRHPPRGPFLDIDGTRLHYIERGAGPVVVLVHGNAVSLEDFEASGTIAALARDHRVIAFDRPGFGHSTRPRDRLWTPGAQATLLNAALERLGVERAVLVGHSLGTMVVLAMALERPANVAGLVLMGGYYYPAMRYDALLVAPVALPVLGDAMRYTVSALTARAVLGTSVKGMFAPVDVPAGFFPTLSREMMLRPSQIGADAEDGVFMMPAARAIAARYGELKMPVVILAGEGDKIVNPDDHSARLHAEMPRSELTVLPDVGHMVHYAAGDLVVDAVKRLTPARPADADASQGSLARPHRAAEQIAEVSESAA